MVTIEVAIGAFCTSIVSLFLFANHIASTSSTCFHFVFVCVCVFKVLDQFTFTLGIGACFVDVRMKTSQTHITTNPYMSLES